MSTTTQLNLARSWRSKQFDEIIGQPLAVRILKNSLYTSHFFPVYLFAGERGCGKTTTARVFAGALNCERLVEFQKDPKGNSVPCLTCASCMAMAAGSHPDFIEMDAASHTGVDNVRSIIEAATFMPVLGTKRIYLIDEAHMLSKSAFNAFLKLLEEPPPSVVFMLATTDPHKIIDTVRSRCFQLFLNPVSDESLLKHLKNICDTEKIAYKQDGLSSIVEESKGLVRDALNLLEQVRFAGEIVTKTQVLTVLGHLDDERLIELFKRVIEKDIASLLTFIKEIALADADASFVWEKLEQFLRAALWLSYGVDQNSSAVELIKKQKIELENDEIVRLLDIFCEHELLFSKTSKKYSLLEMMLIRMCRRSGKLTDPFRVASIDVQKKMPPQNKERTEQAKPVEIVQQEKKEHVPSSVSVSTSESTDDRWDLFLQQVEFLDDQLLPSLFKQAKVSSIESEKVTIQLPERLVFFEDMLKEHEMVWLALLRKIFGSTATLHWEFIAIQEAPVVEGQKEESLQSRSRRFIGEEISRPTNIDVSNKDEWKLTHALLAHFPGTVTEVMEEN